jgi:DNA-binding transcriptional MerR regulator
MKRREQTTASPTTMSISISTAARRAAVDGQVVQYYVEVGLMKERLNDADICELRRVRRLMSLGVNLEGAEIILRMRRRIQELEAELARLRRLRY